MTQRTIIVGDIHGCLEEFEELLKVVEFRPNRDRLVLLGDLVDRGPDPVGVVRRARELGAESVLGNHEEKHLRFRRHEAKKYANPSYKNPMKLFTDARLVEHQSYSAEDWAWLEKLPITLRVAPDWIVVHAGFEPAFPLDKQKAEKMLRVRYVDADGKMKAISSDKDQPPGTVQWASACQEPVHVVYGHMALSMEEPVFTLFYEPQSFAAHCEGHEGNVWLRGALDTACVFGGALSALVLPLHSYLDKSHVSVKAKATYATVWAGGDD